MAATSLRDSLFTLGVRQQCPTHHQKLVPVHGLIPWTLPVVFVMSCRHCSIVVPLRPRLRQSADCQNAATGEVWPWPTGEVWPVFISQAVG